MTIGKIWYEAERSDDGQRRWDLVIVDAPATGHSLQYLRMPHAAHEAFGAGLVGRESQRIVDLLTDPRRTAVNLVTTAEEMPVNETLEMYRQIRDELHMPLGVLFVNRVHHCDFTATDLDGLGERLDSLADPLQRAMADEAVSRGREEVGWSAINRTLLGRSCDGKWTCRWSRSRSPSPRSSVRKRCGRLRRRSRQSPRECRAAPIAMPGLDDILRRHRVVICAGSGGVGKTTTAASLAVYAALSGKRTMVMTIDPAKRLANALGVRRWAASARR